MHSSDTTSLAYRLPLLPSSLLRMLQDLFCNARDHIIPAVPGVTDV